MLLINKLYFVLIFSLFLASCERTGETSKDIAEEVEVVSILRAPDEVIKEDGLTVGLYTYERFKNYLEAENDTIYVVNFWATWCKPCVEELPSFEELYQNYKNKKVRLILVSLDFEKQIESKLIPFMDKHKLKGEVLVLKQKGMNNWIDKIDPSWSGALPATIIYNKNKRAFFEQSFDYEELEEKLQEFL
jgi:thiol-disulfide isomerase/thioredoxin